MNLESSLVIDGLDCSIPSAVYLEKLRAGGVIIISGYFFANSGLVAGDSRGAM